MFRPCWELRQFLPDRWFSHGRNTWVSGSSASTSRPTTIRRCRFRAILHRGRDDDRGFDIRSISPLGISTNPRTDANQRPIIDLNTGTARGPWRDLLVETPWLSRTRNTAYRSRVSLGVRVLRRGHHPDRQGIGTGVLRPGKRRRPRGDQQRPQGIDGVEIQFLLPGCQRTVPPDLRLQPSDLPGRVMVGTTPIYAQEPRKISSSPSVGPSDSLGRPFTVDSTDCRHNRSSSELAALPPGLLPGSGNPKMRPSMKRRIVAACYRPRWHLPPGHRSDPAPQTAAPRPPHLRRRASGSDGHRTARLAGSTWNSHRELRGGKQHSVRSMKFVERKNSEA